MGFGFSSKSPRTFPSGTEASHSKVHIYFNTNCVYPLSSPIGLSPGGGRLFFVDEAVDWILLQIVDEDRGSWDGAIRIAEISSVFKI